jgi:hypothetical protein
MVTAMVAATATAMGTSMAMGTATMIKMPLVMVNEYIITYKYQPYTDIKNLLVITSSIPQSS